MSDPTHPKTRHWKRHEGEATAVDGALEGWHVVASACGRLVDYVFARADPSEADCRECEEIAGLLGEPDDTPNRDELIAYAQKHDLWCYWDRGWVKCEKSHPKATEDLNTAAIKRSADPTP